MRVPSKARVKELIKGALCAPLFALVAVLVLISARRYNAASGR